MRAIYGMLTAPYDKEESPMLARLSSAAVVLLLSIAYATAADISIAVGADVTSIDPHYLNLTPNNNIAEHIFELWSRWIQAR
jgi:hypothetical protein